MTGEMLAQVLGILATGGALWWFVWASDNQKAAVEETLAPVVGTLLSAWNWLLDALIRLKDRITGALTTLLHSEQWVYRDRYTGKGVTKKLLQGTQPSRAGVSASCR
jgi:hypothetical protein